MKNYSLILIPALFALCQAGVSREADRSNFLAFLTFDELVTLSHMDTPPPRLKEKLENLLSAPSLYNSVEERDALPHRPLVNGKPVLRVVAWNIEEGLNFELIKLALSDPDGFLQTENTRAR